jgi:hypothetical protein
MFGGRISAGDDAYCHANVYASARENPEGRENFTAGQRYLNGLAIRSDRGLQSVDDEEFVDRREVQAKD